MSSTTLCVDQSSGSLLILLPQSAETPAALVPHLQLHHYTDLQMSEMKCHHSNGTELEFAHTTTDKHVYTDTHS